MTRLESPTLRVTPHEEKATLLLRDKNSPIAISPCVILSLPKLPVATRQDIMFQKPASSTLETPNTLLAENGDACLHPIPK
jgi:hypothetical protein